MVFRGRRYDTGDRLDYLKAVVQLASERDDLGPPLLTWLRDVAARRSRTGPDVVISVDEHLARVLSVVQPLAPLDLGLLDAHGCVLDEDVVAPRARCRPSTTAHGRVRRRRSPTSSSCRSTLPVIGDVAAGPAIEPAGARPATACGS